MSCHEDFPLLTAEVYQICEGGSPNIIEFQTSLVISAAFLMLLISAHVEWAEELPGLSVTHLALPDPGRPPYYVAFTGTRRWVHASPPRQRTKTGKWSSLRVPLFFTKRIHLLLTAQSPGIF